MVLISEGVFKELSLQDLQEICKQRQQQTSEIEGIKPVG